MAVLPFAVRRLLVLALLTVAAEAQHVAWAWVRPQGQGSAFIPSAPYQFTSSGGIVTVQRDAVQQNRFRVVFAGMAPATGVVQACAHGGNHTVVVNTWFAAGNDVQTWIECFAPDGSPANDAAFVVSFRRGEPPYRRDVYFWADQPTASSYFPSGPYAHGGAMIDRLGTGLYRATVPGFAPLDSELGNVQVTPFSASLLRARVLSWTSSGSDLQIIVQCQNASGAPTDGRFVLSYQEHAAPIPPELGSGAHVWAEQPTVASYAPDPAYTDSNGTAGRRDAERVDRLGVGRYRVHLPDQVPADRSMAHVSPQGLGSTSVAIDRWISDGQTGTFVFVDTFDDDGNPADARFNLLYLTNRPTHQIAWALVDPAGQGQTWTPDPSFSYCSSGEQITISRSAVANNQLTVRLAGFAAPFGVTHVTPVGGNHVVVSKGGIVTAGESFERFEVLDPAGNPLPITDQAFTILFRAHGDPARREAALWASDIQSPSYQPTVYWNGDRGVPTVTRTALGQYAVRLPGLGNLFGAHLGHVQAHGAGLLIPPTPPGRAVVRTWTHSVGDVVAQVRTYDMAGAPADRAFALSYQERAAPIPAVMGTGAHVWADQPHAASYVPPAAYTDSNGTYGPTNAEMITRLGLGHYRVQLPNVAPSASATAQASAFGLATRQVAIESWGSDGATGTAVVVRCFDDAGNAIDGQFTLSYLTDRSVLGEPATAVSFGVGCNGPVLRAVNRPVAGGSWQMDLIGVPPTVQLAFVLIGLSELTLPLGPQAPGCTRYSSGEAVVAVVPPVPSPAYRLNVPPGPTFIGLPLFVQGAALVPGVNALSLATSNGVAGTVGDN